MPRLGSRAQCSRQGTSKSTGRDRPALEQTGQPLGLTESGGLLLARRGGGGCRWKRQGRVGSAPREPVISQVVGAAEGSGSGRDVVSSVFWENIR